jgi:hypothetical protein
MSSATWDSLFGGDERQIRKGLYGSVLIKEYDPANTLGSYSPFDPATGGLSSTLLTTDGFQDCGFLSDNGVQFTPQYAGSGVPVWQSREDARWDATQDSEQAMLTLVQSNPLIDAIRENLPLPASSTPGAPGYSYTKGAVPKNLFRTLLFLGIDGDSFIAKLWPRALMIKPDKQDWNAKTAADSIVTFQPFRDRQSGFSRRTFRDGPGWRASGGLSAAAAALATAITGAKATVTFAAPSGGTAPYVYVIKQTTGGVTTNAAATFSGTTATVTGLTVGSVYTFAVQATDSAAIPAVVTSPASNAITAIA